MNSLALNPARLSIVKVVVSAVSLLVLFTDGQTVPQSRPASKETATLIHRADVLRDRTAESAAPMRLWPLYSNANARMNYVEVNGRSSMHLHPDEDHRLYVLEGSVLVITGTNKATAITGDLIIIPKGVPHAYDVARKGEHALLLTFDAPPYDPKKTLPVKEEGMPKSP